MLKRGMIEEYINKATNIRNQLLFMKEPIHNKSIYQLLLNSLSRCFEDIIQTLSNLDIAFTFDQLSSKLLIEAVLRVLENCMT